MTTNVIICCGCNNQDQKSEYAFKIAFPDEPVPPIHKGKDAALTLSSQYPGTNLSRQLSAIAKLSGQWGYYLQYTASGDITTLYDLVRNKRAQ